MDPGKREKAYEEIRRRALAIGTGVADNSLIDRVNVLRATKIAMRRALEDLKHGFDVVITDYVLLEGYNCLALPKGDEKSLSCACASVVAKVLRDRIMEVFDRVYPEYEFGKHKGYPTKRHRELLRIHGPSDIHRKSFRLLL